MNRIRPHSLLALLLILVLGAASAHAARYPLGTRWMSLREAGIEVFYPEGYDDYARYVQARSRVHADSLAIWYGSEINPIRIVLQPWQDQGSSMAIVQPLRSEISLNPTLDKGLRPQSGFYLDRVLSHELTHLAQFSTHKGWTHAARWIFGDAVAPLGISPDWILEGQAIWSESARGGGRRNSSYHRMLFRTPLLEGKLWTLDQIAFSGSVAPHPSRAYVAGTFLYAELADPYRDYKDMQSWMGAMAEYPALHKTAFGKVWPNRSMEGAYRSLRQEWRVQERDRLVSRQRRGLAVGERLRAAPRSNWRHPVYDSRGRLLVRSSSYDRPAQAEWLAAGGEGEGLARVPVGPAPHDGLSAAGPGLIATRTLRGYAPQSALAELVHVDPQGSTTPLGLRGWAPALHEGSGQLVYVGSEGGAQELRLVDLDESWQPTGPPRTLLRSELGAISDPAWDRQGQRIAFAADLGEGEAIYLIEPGSVELQRLQLAAARASWDPAFGPGDALWLSADVEGVFDLFEIDLKSGSAWRRTRVITGAMEPAVSPDGDTVAYSHYTSEGFSLARLTSDRWLDEPALAESQRLTVGEFESAAALPPGESQPRSYSPLRHAAPIFWLPSWSEGDEHAWGISLIGRDPLGLLSWRLSPRVGLRSQRPDADGQVTWRGAPVDLTLWAGLSQDEVLRYRQVVAPADTVEKSVWRARRQAALTLHQTLRLGRAAHSVAVTPFFGYVTRERHQPKLVYDDQQNPAGFEILGRRYHALRGGLSWQRWRGAARDPVTRDLQQLSLDVEYGPEAISPLAGERFELGGRLHLPAPWHTVFALSGDLQQQFGSIGFSRGAVLPRGYGESELPGELARLGRLARGGLELHFPLLYPDRGLGAGWLFAQSLRGQLFAEAASGWGAGSPLDEGFAERGISSVGVELSSGGYLLYDIQTRLSVGIAYRLPAGEPAFFWNIQFPSLIGAIGESGRRR